jgi:hypothetical protein
MNQDLLGRINSATKYPSIPTYHAMGERGCLTENLSQMSGSLLNDNYVPLAEHDKLFLSEKIDGTNARIIYRNGDWFIGCREEILTHIGDWVFNPDNGIVEALMPGLLIHKAEAWMLGNFSMVSRFAVWFLEVYGGKLPANKQYTGHNAMGFRVFDFALVPHIILEESRETISGWRQRGGQEFLTTESIYEAAKAIGMWSVPHLGITSGSELPTDVSGTLAWMHANSQDTNAKLDPEAQGKLEGIVIRSADRRAIAKLRFEDYQKTMNLRKLKEG